MTEGHSTNTCFYAFPSCNTDKGVGSITSRCSGNEPALLPRRIGERSAEIAPNKGEAYPK